METRRSSRYESLDVWRGVACLTVVVFHSVLFVATPDFQLRMRTQGGSALEWLLYATTYLWLGLPLFFVISGYCIAATADSTRRKSGSTAQYFWRRFKRIYPPLWICIAIFAVALALIPDDYRPKGDDAPRPSTLTPINWVGNITLTEEWRPNIVGPEKHYDGPEKHYLLGHTWTLCYEEQFYAVIGLILLVTRRWFFAMAAGVTALVYLNTLNLNGPLSVLQYHGPGFFFDGMWLSFAAGVLVYYRLNYASASAGRMLEALLLVALFISWRMNKGILDNEMNLSRFLIISFAFSWLLIRLRGFDAWMTRQRWLTPVRYCGQRCYSLYLVHGALVVVTAWNLVQRGINTPAGVLLIVVPIGLTLTIVTGSLFYRLVERHFLNAPVGNAPPATDKSPNPGSADSPRSTNVNNPLGSLSSIPGGCKASPLGL